MLSIWTVTGALQGRLPALSLFALDYYTELPVNIHWEMCTTDILLDDSGGQQHCLTGVCKSLDILS